MENNEKLTLTLTVDHKVSKVAMNACAWWGADADIREKLMKKLAARLMDYLTIDVEDCGDCLEYIIMVECRDLLRKNRKEYEEYGKF